MKVVLHESVQPKVAGLLQEPGRTVLLHGQKQVGKRTLAVEIARQLNCLGCDDGSCTSCKQIVGENHPNVLFVTPDAKGKIGIDAVHELQRSLQYERYLASGVQVVIVVGADTLTLPAQNALLKTLEEPPVGTLLALTAVSPNALIPTVRSRCLEIYLPTVTQAQMKTVIGTDDNADQIVQLSEGSVGRALTYTKNPELLREDLEAATLVRSFVGEPNTFERLRLAAELASNSERRAFYLRTLRSLLRNQARGTSSVVTRLGSLERLHERLRSNVNPKTAFEAMAVELS